MKWVLIKKMAEQTGYSEGALRQKIQRGDWLQGIHFVNSPDGRVQINIEAYNRWIEGEKPGLK